jgi:DNA-directed RNA polymerase sigma subunit (sigma70/sigma32)
MGISRLARSLSLAKQRSRRRADKRRDPLRSLPAIETTFPVADLDLLAALADSDRIPESLMPSGQVRSKEVAQDTEKASVATRVDQAVSDLSVLEGEVIRALFPPGGAPQSHEEIAKRFGLTIIEVKDIEANALRGLRGLRPAGRKGNAPWN